MGKTTPTTCREEILRAAQALTLRSGRPEFSLARVIEEMHRRGTRYADSTIRTHVSSRMCAGAPGHHGVVYNDLERVGRGLYRVRVPGG
jgi:hypothetical protein